MDDYTARLRRWQRLMSYFNHQELTDTVSQWLWALAGSLPAYYQAIADLHDPDRTNGHKES